MKAVTLPLVGTITPDIKGKSTCVWCRQTFPRAYTGSRLCIGCRLEYRATLAEVSVQDQAAAELEQAMGQDWPTGYTDDF